MWIRKRRSKKCKAENELLKPNLKYTNRYEGEQ